MELFSAHHQEFSTIHSALVSFMQVSDDRFQVESRWNCASGWLFKKKSITMHGNMNLDCIYVLLCKLNRIHTVCWTWSALIFRGYLVMKPQGKFEYEASAFLLLLNTAFTPQVESRPRLIRSVQQGRIITVTLFKINFVK